MEHLGKIEKSEGPWLRTVDDPNEALIELLEFMTSRCFVHNDQQSTVRGYLVAINVFPQDVRRLGATFVALHDRRSGKGDRQGARCVYQEKNRLDCP